MTIKWYEFVDDETNLYMVMGIGEDGGIYEEDSDIAPYHMNDLDELLDNGGLETLAREAIFSCHYIESMKDMADYYHQVEGALIQIREGYYGDPIRETEI